MVTMRMTIIMTWMMMLSKTVKGDCNASPKVLKFAMDTTLSGYNFSTFSVQSVYQCMEMCSYFSVCLSVNFFTKTHSCQLNNANSTLYISELSGSIYANKEEFPKTLFPECIPQRCNESVPVRCVSTSQSTKCVTMGLYVRSTAKVIYGREKLRKKEKPGSMNLIVCPVGWVCSGDTAYHYSTEKMNYQDGKIYCQEMNASLIEIESEAESDFLFIHRRPDEAYLLAMDDLENEGTFVWASGRKVEYQRWDKGQPNNFKGIEHCALIRTDSKLWNDAACFHVFFAICERQFSP